MDNKLKPKSVKFENKDKYQRILGGIPDTSGMKSGSVVLGVGESVGEHNTEFKEEAIIIIDGEAEIYTSSGEPIKAKKETLVYIPPDTVHNVKNAGSDVLRYVYVTAPVKIM
jgi:quercetin dioxygenase-like cupin family protein